jgi:hypothetical protein
VGAAALVGAAVLLGGAYDVCTAAAGFADVTALAIAESTRVLDEVENRKYRKTSYKPGEINSR